MKIFKKIKGISKKLRFKKLLNSIEISCFISVVYKPKDEEKLFKYLKEFNEKNYPNENDRIISSPLEEIKKGDEEESSPFDHIFKSINEDIKAPSKKIDELLDKANKIIDDTKYAKDQTVIKSIGTGKTCLLKDIEVELKKIEEYLKKLGKEKPKGLKFEFEINYSFTPNKKFTDEDVKLLVDKGYNYLPLISYEELKKDVEENIENNPKFQKFRDEFENEN